jgi:tetratricopeptide (TPR) repeat protein
MNEEFDQAGTALTEVLNYSRRYGANILGVYATAFLGAVYIAAGRSSAGMAMIRKSIRVAEANQRKTVQAILEYVLGKIFVQLAIPQEPPRLKYLVSNIGFLLKNIPFAGKKAEKHLRTTISLSQSIGAEGILGQALFDLGSYYKEKAKYRQSKECLEEALGIFLQTGSENFRRRTEALLSFLKGIG